MQEPPKAEVKPPRDAASANRAAEPKADFESASSSTPNLYNLPSSAHLRQPKIYFGQGLITKGRYVINFHETETHGQGRHKVVRMGQQVDWIDRFNRKTAANFQTWVTDGPALQEFCEETLLELYDGDFPKVVDEEFLQDLLHDLDSSSYRAFDGRKVDEFLFKRQRGRVIERPQAPSDPDEEGSLAVKLRRTIYYAEVVTDDELGEYELIFEDEKGEDKGMFELFDADPAFIQFCYATLVHPPQAGGLENMGIDVGNIRHMNKFLNGRPLDGEKVEALIERRTEFDAAVQEIIDRRSLFGAAKPTDRLVPTIYGVRRRYGK